MSVLPLDGVRVLDLSRVVSGPFTTQVLGDLGAEVIRVESPELAHPSAPPEALSLEEAHTWGLNRNKRSICVDLKKPAGRELVQRLAGESDVVFDNFRPGVLGRLGLDHDTLTRIVGPHVITCSLTGFWESGPWAQSPAYDPIVQAMSGAMHITRLREQGGPPVRWGIPIGDLFTGLYSCIGILAALVERERTGWGQHVDVAMLDVMLALNTVRVPLALSFGQEPKPMPFEGGQGTVPYGTFECRDGWIAIGVMERRWARACAIVGRPDLAEDPRFVDRAARQLNREALVTEFGEALRVLPVGDVEREFLEAGIVAGRVTGIGEVFDHPQVWARGMAVEIADRHGRSATVAGDPLHIADPSTWRAPSRPGSDTGLVLSTLLGLGGPEIDGLRHDGVVAGADDPADVSADDPADPLRPRHVPSDEPAARPGNAPLDGMLVVELDGEEPSKAFAGQILADLGARVVRVDRPPTQHDDPYPDTARASAYRCGLNRNKQSVTADLKSPDGQAFVRALIGDAAAVLDNYRPGVLDRLGLDHDTLTGINPEIVSCSITGFGHTGPWSRYAAFDAAIQALGGGQSITAGHNEPGKPVRWANPIGGLTASMYAAIGVLAGIRGRLAHGRGRRIDLAMLDAQVSLLSYRVPQAVTLGRVYRPDPRRGGTGSLPFGIFEAAGGTWFVLGITQQFWARFCEVVGRPEWSDDPRLVDEPTRRDNEDLLNGLIEEQMLTADAATWEARFHEARLPGAAVVTVSEAFAGEQVVARDMRVVLDDPVHPGGVSVAGQPVKLSAYPAPEFRPAPVSGADTAAVRAEFVAEPVIG